MPKIAVIGTTSWGMTLAMLLADKGQQVRLWARTEKETEQLQSKGLSINRVLFPLSDKISVTSSLEATLQDVKAVILAVPSQTVRHNVQLLNPYLKKSMLIISAAKGLEIGSNKRMSQVIAEEIKPRCRDNICVLSGPNLSQEISRGLPAATIIAAENEEVAKTAQKLLVTPNLCVYTHTDIAGVELGGALKNIIALGAGMADGLGYGDNAKAAFITRGLTEISALGIALGASPLTFSGLAGFGDLIATCVSGLSRNHYVGVELTKGRSLKEITASMDGVAEGVTTTIAALALAKEHGIAMPITEKIYEVLYMHADPRQAAKELMNAPVGHELKGRRWKLFSLFRRRKKD